MSMRWMRVLPVILCGLLLRHLGSGSGLCCGLSLAESLLEPLPGLREHAVGGGAEVRAGDPGRRGPTASVGSAERGGR